MHSPCSGTITNCGSSSIPISRERLVGAAHALFIWYTSKVCEGHLHDIVPLILITSQDYRPVGWCETAVQRRGISACFGGQKQGEKTQSANHGTWKDAAAVAVHLLTILSRFILFSGPAARVIQRNVSWSWIWELHSAHPGIACSTLTWNIPHNDSPTPPAMKTSPAPVLLMLPSLVPRANPDAHAQHLFQPALLVFLQGMASKDLGRGHASHAKV